VTLFAGICAPRRDTPLNPTECAGLKTTLSRHPSERVEVVTRPGFFVATANLGVLRSPLPEPGPTGDVVWVAGDPFLPDTWSPHDPVDLRAFRDADPALLRQCRGTYCGFTFDEQAHRLRLLSDAGGVRPIYFIVQNGCLYFSSALRVFEDCGLFRLTVDLRGAIEAATFGFSFADRTPYAWVRRIGASEIVTFDALGLRREPYFLWDTLPAGRPVDADGLRELGQRFQEAVRLRLSHREAADAFLSGGLDSRCVVATLLANGAPVRTYNFSWPGTLDRVLGRMFAERAGTRHAEIPLPEAESGDAWPRLMAAAIRTADREPGSNDAALAWSGDGGSVGVGRVYLDEIMLVRGRERDIPGAIAAIFAENPSGVPLGALNPALRARAGEIPWLGVREELLALNVKDGAQGIFLYFLLNDQRRHLTAYFENLDRNRVEYELPFFDAEFLKRTASFRIDDCLFHRMYNRWTEVLPGVVREVPWQSYPGHEPGPLPLPSGVAPQWSSPGPARRRALRSRLEREAGALLTSEAFPTPLLGRGRFRIMLELTRFGLRDYAYALRFAGELERYWRVAGGRYA
jgi:asparagine synthase (glutamine-hydrolysing)